MFAASCICLTSFTSACPCPPLLVHESLTNCGVSTRSIYHLSDDSKRFLLLCCNSILFFFFVPRWNAFWSINKHIGCTSSWQGLQSIDLIDDPEFCRLRQRNKDKITAEVTSSLHRTSTCWLVSRPVWSLPQMVPRVQLTLVYHYLTWQTRRERV